MLRAALVAAVLLLSPLPAAAVTTLAAWGDSISQTTFDGGGCCSYLQLLGPDYAYEEHTVAGQLTADMLVDMAAWVADGVMNGFGDVETVVLLTGTPDTAQWPGYFFGPYDEMETLANIQAMVDLILDDAGLGLVLVSPLPTIYPCDGIEDDSGGLTCAAMDARLDSLTTELAALALLEAVPFVDAYDIFSNDPAGLATLLKADGLHPTVAGDQLLADGVTSALVLIPEPSTAALLGAALVALGLRRRSGHRA